jgi:nucleotide-binding universal stress UspA family protein
MTGTTKQPFRKILVATDFSKSADAALMRGAWLAEKCRAELVVAHVLTDLRQAFIALPYAAKTELLYGDIEKFERALRADSQRQLAKSVRRQAKRSVTFKTETLLGKPDVALTHAVQQEGYDLVLLGTRGVTGLKRFFLGSTASRLIRECPASVWVVKAAHGWPLKRLLVGVDFSDVSRRALEHAGWLAAQANTILDVLHVIEIDDVFSGFKPRQREAVKESDVGRHIEENARQRLEEWCARLGLPASQLATHVVWGTGWKTISDRCRRWHSDLIVLGAVGRSGISGLLIGNTAEKVLNTCDCSVLTVKPLGFVSPIQPPAWELHPTDEPQTVRAVAR